MMIYVFDTSSLSILKDYYPERFRNFWKCFNELVAKSEIISVREVYNELDGKVDRPHIQEWINSHRDIFLPPSAEESQFMREIFAIAHFQSLIKPSKLLVSTPWADPFVIASAKVRQGCVVTEEENKPNGARIPNVCEYFGIPCEKLEGFLEKQKWEF